MVLALTPSDAVVESAFSRLSKILTDQRMSISTDLLEQLLFVAVDSTPWEDYDLTEVINRVRGSAPREKFRLARADKQSSGRKRKRAPSSKEKADDVVLASDDDSSSSSSSDSDAASE